MSLKGLLFFWNETRADPDPFIIITLFGQFKGETRHRWHCLPICDHNRSGIPFRKWINRLPHRRLMVQKRSEDWLFKKGKQCARLRDFDKVFVHYARRIHSLYPGLFLVETIL